MLPRKRTDRIRVVQGEQYKLKTYYYHLRKIRKKLCEQIAVPVMTVEDTNPTVKLRMADVTAEITDNTSEQLITMIIRAIRNA